MSKHDSLVSLSFEGQNLSRIFPHGIPVRDPFPMAFGYDPDLLIGSQAWVIDDFRITKEQSQAWTGELDFRLHCAPGAVLTGPRWILHRCVVFLTVGPEGWQRFNEWVTFAHAIGHSDDRYITDCLHQHKNSWIFSSKNPDPLPTMDELKRSDLYGLVRNVKTDAGDEKLKAITLEIAHIGFPHIQKP